MNSIACYYKSIEKNYDLTKKYYLMAIEKGNIQSIQKKWGPFIIIILQYMHIYKLNISLFIN